MKALRVPVWLREEVLAAYHARTAHVFLLHGNTGDLQPMGAAYVTLGHALRQLVARRPAALCWEPGSGLTVLSDDDAGLRARLGVAAGGWPTEASRALPLLDRLLRDPAVAGGSVAVVIESAHAVLPEPPGSAVERQLSALVARWSTDPEVAARRPLVLLTAPSARLVSREVCDGPGASLVLVPRPDEALRRVFLRHVAGSGEGVRAEKVETLAAETGGLSLARIASLARRAAADSGTLDEGVLREHRVDLLGDEYGDVLEIVAPRHGLDAVGGLEEARRELSEVAALMRRGERSAVPMGVLLMGPPGTGKSFLAECFARECGLLCVRFRPLRHMYVGESERNQERAFAAIRSLAPVVVVVDESDQAEGGGDRNSAEGDGGVADRMRGAALSFWGDPTLRGRVLRVDITNRPDRIDAALRRSGRTDVKIPILMPGEDARRQILEVTVRKHGLASEVSDFGPWARRSHGLTGSDLELAVTTAWRFALQAGERRLTAPHLDAAFGDLLPARRDQAAIDSMTLLALDECRNRRLLPANSEAIRAEIEARRES